ncbi:hypothetical protein KKE26_10210 [bacterium]|nr:hypothetical protein [bacterium]MBU1753286.1 hypothetical protein [bacterium]
MKKEESTINCALFQKQEIVIKDITIKINMSQGLQEKAKFAETLQGEVGVLLSCPDYDTKRLDCTNCHFIANLREKTAGLIMKIKESVQHN